MKALIFLVATVLLSSSMALACMQGPGSTKTDLKLKSGETVGSVTEVVTSDLKNHTVIFFTASNLQVKVSLIDIKGNEKPVPVMVLAMLNGGTAVRFQNVISGGESLKIVANDSLTKQEFTLAKPAVRGCADLQQTSSSSGTQDLPVYNCVWLPNHGGASVGTIQMVGDPVKSIFVNVLINGVAQKIRPGTTSNVYLYLYDLETNQPTLALEVVNFPASNGEYEISVYGPDHIVLGSLRIARYQCNLVP